MVSRSSQSSPSTFARLSSRRARHVFLGLLCALAGYLAWHGAFLRPEAHVIRPGELLAANITLVLPLNQSQPIAREVVKAILATTVGPYELIIVHIPGPDTEAVADFLDDLFGRRQDARASPLFAHYPTEQLRGLHSVTRLTAKRGSDMTAATQTGLNAARNPLVVLLDDETEQLDYGWDRQLLRPMAQSADLIAISGVCAYDLTPPTAPDGRTAWVPSSLAGHCARTPKDVVQLPVSYDVRDVAVQSPLLVDRTKLRRLGTLRGDLSSLGHQPFAAEMCLKARLKHNWRCGHVPVSLRAPPHWQRGFPPPADAPTSRSTRATAALATEVLGRPRTDSGDLVSRRLEIMAAKYAPRVIATAASQNHFTTMRTFFYSLRRYESVHLVVFDLGFDDRTRKLISEWPDTEVRVFDFESYPEHFNMAFMAGQYAWKPVIVRDLAREFGGLVLWLDSGNHVWRPLTEIWRHVAAGVYSTRTPGSRRAFVHTGTLDYFRVPLRERDGWMCNGALLGFHAGQPEAVVKVLEPWYDCALDRECIAPKGSNYYNSRQDQSSLTVLMALNGFKCDLGEGADKNKLEWTWKGPTIEPPSSAPLAVTVHHDDDDAWRPQAIWDQVT